MKRENCRFWMVWTKTGRVPRFTHNNADAAHIEAARLAAKHPGKKFIVLEASMKYSVPNVSSEVAHAA